MKKHMLNHFTGRDFWQAKLDWYAWTKRYESRLRWCYRHRRKWTNAFRSI